MQTRTVDELVRENEDLRQRLEDAEEALRAIRAGEVDAVLIEAEREQVYTLETPDSPYRLLVARVPHAAVTLRTDGSILCCNRRFAEILDRPDASVTGRHIRDLVAPGSHAVLETLLRDGAAGEVHSSITLLRGDGTPVPLYLGVSPLREGALGLCLMVTDQTEQRHYEELRKTQEALRESRERLANELAAARRLQEISAGMIQEGDVDRLYDQLLEAAMSILRSDCATLQTVDPADGSLRLLAHRGLCDDLVESFRTIKTDAGTVCGIAHRIRRRVVAPDLETFEGIAGTAACRSLLKAGIRAVQSTPLLSRSGHLLGMISTHWRKPHRPADGDLGMLDVLARQAADLIERKHAEQALRDADRKKDEFLATLAHELRNPLAPIRNAAQILKAKGPPILELQWAREVINRQVRLMARLLEDLLDVSRISRQKLDLRTEPVELAAIVEAALETSRPVIDAAGHELTIDLPREPIHLSADPVRLAQVFANLLNNAAKYTGPGGRIRLSAERQANDVHVSVKDTGIGIARDVLPHIFDIFSQAKSAIGHSQGGLGIGLSLVKGLVELHDGSIEVRSAGPGQGSEFVVCLPLASQAPFREPESSDEEEPRPPVKRRRILIVDDNRDSADSLAKLLEIMGHEIGTAYDGEEAIQAAASFAPDVVLLDIGMPKLNGYDAGRRIRELPCCRNTFLIAVTGWGQEQDRRRTVEAGFNHHIVKPVNPEELMQVLASLPTRDAR